MSNTNLKPTTTDTGSGLTIKALENMILMHIMFRKTPSDDPELETARNLLSLACDYGYSQTIHIDDLFFCVEKALNLIGKTDSKIKTDFTDTIIDYPVVCDFIINNGHTRVSKVDNESIEDAIFKRYEVIRCYYNLLSDYFSENARKIDLIYDDQSISEEKRQEALTELDREFKEQLKSMNI